MEELKPCPFCGKTHKISTREHNTFGFKSSIWCDKASVESVDFGDTAIESQQNITEKWNTRKGVVK